ncbi:MAG: ester cyclase [Chitinophagaceae bacterium]
MENVTLQPQADSVTRQNMQAYFKTHDVEYMTEDVVFTHMSSGEETKGKEAVSKMLHYMYHVAFDAQATNQNTIITGDKAVLEATFEGTHIGEFVGIQPTKKNVAVPFCVVYDLENGLIKKGRVYMLTDVMIKQLTGK